MCPKNFVATGVYGKHKLYGPKDPKGIYGHSLRDSVEIHMQGSIRGVERAPPGGGTAVALSRQEQTTA